MYNRKDLFSFLSAYSTNPLTYSEATQEAVLPVFNRNQTGFPTAVCREVMRDLIALRILDWDASFTTKDAL